MAVVKEVASLVEVLKDLEERGIPESQRIYPINDYLSMKARILDIPASGSFELTPFCNLDCKMCYVHLNPEQLESGQRLRTVDEWKSIIDQAIDAGMISAQLTGGECLTYPGFKEVYLHLYTRGVRTAVMTNGRLLTKEMVAFFAEHQPSIIQITVYGSSEDAYERVCGHRAFREVVDGIERATNVGLQVYCTISPSRYMQEDADALFDLLRSMNVAYFLGGAMLPARAETGRKLDEFTVEAGAYSSMMKKERQYRAELRNKAETKEVPRYMPLFKGKLRGLPCGGGHSGFHINWKGEMCPCIAFSHTVHYPIPENGFLDTWKRIVETMKNYQAPAECSQCKLKEYCHSCPGEKSMCSLNGALNKDVCMRLKQEINNPTTMNPCAPAEF